MSSQDIPIESGAGIPGSGKEVIPMSQDLYDLNIEGLDSDGWIRLRREAEAREAEGIERSIAEAEAIEADKRKKTAKTDPFGYYVFTDIPGSGKGWTLAVLAVNRRDAGEYINNVHRGGRFSYSVIGGGTVNATCGAVTSKAQERIRKNNREKGIF